MKNFSIEIKWAIRFILLVLAWAIGEQMAGLHDRYISKYWLYSGLFAIPAVLFYYLAIKEKKGTFKKGMTWGQGFVSSIVLTVFITLLYPFAQYVIYSAISPEYFANMIAYKIEQTTITRENAQSIFNMKTAIVQGIVDSLSYGIITGALVSLLLKNKSTKI